MKYLPEVCLRLTRSWSRSWSRTRSFFNYCISYPYCQDYRGNSCNQSVCLSVSVCLPVCLSISLSICLSVSLFLSSHQPQRMNMLLPSRSKIWINTIGFQPYFSDFSRPRRTNWVNLGTMALGSTAPNKASYICIYVYHREIDR